MIDNITAGVLIVGDEVLSGRTPDLNLNYIARRLDHHGVALQEARIIPDNSDKISCVIQELKSLYTFIFVTGGIGPTHDDVTAKAVARAFEVPLALHPQAVYLLEKHYEEKIQGPRLKMALLPEGAELILNPASAAPGFFMENVYVMAGVPRIMQSMFDGLLLTLRQGKAFYTKTVSCFIGESRIADALTDLQQMYADISIGSYPFFKQGQVGTSLVARGHDALKVLEVKHKLCKLIEMAGGEAIEES